MFACASVFEPFWVPRFWQHCFAPTFADVQSLAVCCMPMPLYCPVPVFGFQVEFSIRTACACQVFSHERMTSVSLTAPIYTHQGKCLYQRAAAL